MISLKPMSTATTRFGRTRHVLAVAATTALMAAGVVVGTGSAKATTPTNYTIVANDGQVADVANANPNPGAGLIQYTANGGLNQTFQFTPQNGGYAIGSLIHETTHYCAQAADYAGGQVTMQPCNGTASQTWNVSASSTGGDLITSAATGLVWDVYGNSTAPGASIDNWYPNGGSNQDWSINGQ